MKNIKLHHTLFIIAAIVYVCGAIAFLTVQYVVERNKMIAEIDSGLFMAVDAARYILPDDYADRAIAADAIASEEYESLGKSLTKYAHKYNVSYLYSMYRGDDGIVYETATSAETESDDDFYYFKESEGMMDGHTERLFALFDAKPDENMIYLENYGRGVLADNRIACRRFTSDREVPFVICAESDLETMEAKLRSHIFEQLGYLLLLFVLVIPLLIAYRVRSKNKEDELNKIVVERTEDLSVALKEANRLNKAKSDFLANMSHELRTPLNAIIGFSELLSMGEMADMAAEYGKTINTSGKHLLSLINDVLDFSKVEANKYSLNEEKLNIVSMVDSIKGIIIGYKNASEKNISYKIDDGIPMLKADERMIRQILLNMMSNAIKFTDKKDSRIELGAKYNTSTKEISFVITDNGIGISDEDLKNIFEPFKQASNVTTKKYEGTGLGLALVHRFIEMHNGKVNIESHLGEGTTFTITFPASRSV